MKKVFYAFRHILPVFHGRILVFWLLILYTSFFFSYFFSVYHTRRTFLFQSPQAESMENMLLINFPYDQITPEECTKRNELIAHSDGVAGIVGIYHLIEDQLAYTAFAYPSSLLNQMKLKDDHNGAIQTNYQYGDARPVWIDARLKSRLPLGTSLSFSALSHITGSITKPTTDEYYVAGYLNKDHITITWGGLQGFPTLSDIINTGHHSMYMITLSDGMEKNPENDQYMLPVLLVQTEGPAVQWRTSLHNALAQKGIGSVYTYGEVIDNTRLDTQSFLDSTAGNLIYLLPMSLFALFGMQQLLMNRLRRTQSVLTLCGMEQHIWVKAWLLALSFMLLLPSILGYVLFVVLQRMDIMYPLSTAVAPPISSLLIIILILYILGIIGLIPTLLSQKNNLPVLNEDGGSL